MKNFVKLHSIQSEYLDFFVQTSYLLLGCLGTGHASSQFQFRDFDTSFLLQCDFQAIKIMKNIILFGEKNIDTQNNKIREIDFLKLHVPFVGSSHIHMTPPLVVAGFLDVFVVSWSFSSQIPRIFANHKKKDIRGKIQTVLNS